MREGAAIAIPAIVAVGVKRGFVRMMSMSSMANTIAVIALVKWPSDARIAVTPMHKSMDSLSMMILTAKDAFTDPVATVNIAVSR